ncbi:MAG: RNA polymerase sigma factor [Desulfobacteraceae bacterium]
MIGRYFASGRLNGCIAVYGSEEDVRGLKPDSARFGPLDSRSVVAESREQIPKIRVSTGSADPPESDETLLQAAGRGDPDSFARIVERHQTWAWSVAYRFTGNEDDALYIVQEAFLRLLDASARYRPVAKFRTFFYRIISHLCLDRAEKKQPLFLETTPDSPDPLPGAPDVMERRETAAAVRSALDRLPAQQRLAVIFRYYEDLNYEEIAEIMETTAKAVERLLARGREGLRDALGRRGDFFVE